MVIILLIRVVWVIPIYHESTPANFAELAYVGTSMLDTVAVNYHVFSCLFKYVESELSNTPSSQLIRYEYSKIIVKIKQTKLPRIRRGSLIITGGDRGTQTLDFFHAMEAL